MNAGATQDSSAQLRYKHLGYCCSLQLLVHQSLTNYLDTIREYELANSSISITRGLQGLHRFSAPTAAAWGESQSVCPSCGESIEPCEPFHHPGVKSTKSKASPRVTYEICESSAHKGEIRRGGLGNITASNRTRLPLTHAALVRPTPRNRAFWKRHLAQPQAQNGSRDQGACRGPFAQGCPHVRRPGSQGRGATASQARSLRRRIG